MEQSYPHTTLRPQSGVRPRIRIGTRIGFTSRTIAAAMMTLGLVSTLTACSDDATAGKDAVSVGGDFSFVSPGGKQVITYAPSERKAVGNISGPSLLQPDTTISLDDFKDQIVVLNAWGQWCGPCRAEVDDLMAVNDQLGDRGTVLGLNVKDFNRQSAADFVTDNGVHYPSIYDPPFRTAIGLGGFPASVVPTTIVLDRQHRPAAVFLRSVNTKEVMDVIDSIDDPAGPKAA